MRILTRYLLRAHLGPFLFSLSVLTGLLLVNTVAKRFEDLAGKGLGVGIITEVFILSIPYTLALTLPMSVLVAVLYAFSQLTSDNEITALKASGVSLLRLSAPLLVVGALMTGGMLYFNDQILSESNHRLKNLLVDIARKSPTLELKEQVINEIRTEGVQARYYLRPARIDAAANRLYDVVIYDLSSRERDRTIYADSGWMAFNESRTDLFLTLYDGWIHEREHNAPDRFNRIFFREQLIRIPEIGNQLMRMGSGVRGDREMTVAMLKAEVTRRREELDILRTRARDDVVAAVQVALGNYEPVDGGDRRAGFPVRLGEPDLGEVDSAGSSAPASAARDARLVEAHTLRMDARQLKIQLENHQNRAAHLQAGINEYAVEYHKKFAIPFACIVFVMIGAPLAVRFPRGGAGMVIAFSLVIFAIYWSGLTGGETLGDKGLVPPFWGMWAVNIIFLALGLFALARFGRETANTRGGALDGLLELVHRLRGYWRARRARAGGAATGVEDETMAPAATGRN